MKLQIRSLISLFLLIASISASAASPTAKGDAAAPNRALMQKVLDAWATLDAGNAAPYYDKSANDVFYDIAPLEYHGWAEYQKGAQQVISSFNSLKFTVNDDAAIHNEGKLAWGTATWSATAEMKNGNKVSLTGRWTAIWRNEGGKWLIVHEQLSVPADLSGGEKRER